MRSNKLCVQIKQYMERIDVKVLLGRKISVRNNTGSIVDNTTYIGDSNAIQE